jgi:hypothetical protein
MAEEMLAKPADGHPSRGNLGTIRANGFPRQRTGTGKWAAIMPVRGLIRTRMKGDRYLWISRL